MSRLLSAILVLIAVSACTVTPPTVRVASPVPVVAVEVEHPDGYHCPPGQAKKGRC